jgi:hypothetical protein
MLALNSQDDLTVFIREQATHRDRTSDQAQNLEKLRPKILHHPRKQSIHSSLSQIKKEIS